MGWIADQERLIDDALDDADEATLRRTLEGTLGDASVICRAALTQFEPRVDLFGPERDPDLGQDYADKHSLLLLAEEAVCHAEWVVRLLGALGSPTSLPIDPDQRRRLCEARNLLAEHRDERVVYWRLTGQHTPHVADVYRRLGVELPDPSIDTEQLGGERVVGHFLSLRALHDDLVRLGEWLGDLSQLDRNRFNA